MSSSCSPVALLVLMGVVLAFANIIPPNMILIDNYTQDLLDLKNFGDKPLFSSVINSINTSCQRKEDIMLMNTTLGIYTRMFSNILHSHPQPSGSSTPTLLGRLSDEGRHHVKKELERLQEKIRNRRRDLQEPRDHKELLRELSKIKVDDPVDQRRALAEFTLVFKAASNLVE